MLADKLLTVLVPELPDAVMLSGLRTQLLAPLLDQLRENVSFNFIADLLLVRVGFVGLFAGSDTVT